MPECQERLLQQLTGVDSSKLNYYVELKKRNREVLRQNVRLKVLHQLARDMNLDMSIGEMCDRTFRLLPEALPCDLLAVLTQSGSELSLKAMSPGDFCTMDTIPADALLWRVLETGETLCCDSAERIATFLCPDSHLRSLVVAPLFERGTAVGLLLLGSRQPHAYMQEEMHFVQHLADQLAIGILNGRLFRRVSRAKKEWEETFNAVTDPVLLIDTDYNILLHNNRLPAFWDGAPEAKCYERLQWRSDPCPECPMDVIRKSEEPFSRRIQGPDGELLDISYYPVFNEDHQLVALTLFAKDVTRKTRLEAQLVHSARLAALGEMAAGVAHELNSPMTVIIGTGQMLQRDLEAQGMKEDAEGLGDIVNCGLRCKRIIQNLLTFSRQDQAPHDETDLNQEVERILSLIKYQINRSQIEIKRNLDLQMPRISANGPQIQQVLTNLLVNARDALTDADRQEKVIEVSTGTRSQGDKTWVVIKVQDNGTGIPPENLSKIFTPFFTSKEETKGTGLGLSVSLGIAESHNGTIEVESTWGVGSTFSLILPTSRN